ncbi:hypothetical protein RHECNPAF_45002 [Rhizobium etli CNPAF512]|nr:hypothetical protein RHECNPAF_45002 [Rhizobium etli CNPAF512]
MSSVIGGVPQVGSSNPTLPEITDGYEIQLHHSIGHDQEAEHIYAERSA